MKIVMPQLGMTMQEGTLEKWLVKDGDTVEKGQPMMEITTEKLTNEIECPESGVIKLLVAEGDIIPCGGDVAEIN